MRKYPSLPFLDRRCNKDFTIDSGVTIPKGTPIFIPSIGLHYDKEHFPDPHRFDPDRFLPENAKNRHPFVFLPFGNGPHNCIGMKSYKIYKIDNYCLYFVLQENVSL